MLNLKKFKHVHCIGIGGIGLSAIAEIFLTLSGLIKNGAHDFQPILRLKIKGEM